VVVIELFAAASFDSSEIIGLPHHLLMRYFYPLIISVVLICHESMMD